MQCLLVFIFVLMLVYHSSDRENRSRCVYIADYDSNTGIVCMDDLAVAHVHSVVTWIVYNVSSLCLCQTNAFADLVDAHSRNAYAEVVVQRIDIS